MFTGKVSYPRIMKVYKSNGKPILGIDGRPVIKVNSSSDPDYIAPEFRSDLCNNPATNPVQTTTTTSSSSTTTQTPVDNCSSLYVSSGSSIDCNNSLFNKITLTFRLPFNKISLELHKDNNIVLVLENLDVIGNQVTFNAPKSVVGNISFVAVTPTCPKFEFNDTFTCAVTTTTSTTTTTTTTSTSSTSTTNTSTTTTNTSSSTTSSTTQTTLPGQTTTTTTTTSTTTTSTTKFCGGLVINNLIIQDARNVYADLTIGGGWTQFIWTVRYGGAIVATGTTNVTSNPYNFYSYDNDFIVGRTYDIEIHPIGCPAGTYTSTTYSSSPVVSNQAIILNKLNNGTVYAYEPSTNTIKQLFIGAVGSDIAHTETVLYILAYDQTVKKYAITLNPFTYTKLTDISIVGHEGAGIAVANADVFYIGTSGGKVDQWISGSFTTLFNLPSGYACTGDLVYDTVRERFLISYNNNTTGDYRVGIFSKTGTVIRSVVAPANDIYGIYQYSGVTYLISGSGQQYTINLTTMAIAISTNIGVSIAGGGQLPQNVNIPS